MIDSSEWALFAGVALRLGLMAGVTAIGLAMYREIRRREPWLSLVVAAGILLRAIAGLTLFWISYLDLPILAQLHQGGGFWDLAPDARLYFDLAVGLAERGAGSLPFALPSPGYVWALAIWMSLVGISPASALLLNLSLYLFVCYLLTRYAARTERIARLALVVSVFAISFSPALILVSTQSLKDVFFLTLVAITCVSWLYIVRALDDGSPVFLCRVGLGFAALSACAFLLSAVRPYYGLFLFGSTVLGLILLARSNGRRLLNPGGIATACAGLVSVYAGFMLGAGPYYPLVSPQRFLPGASVAPAIKRLDTYREGFIQSGGNTNLVRRAEAQIAHGGAPAHAGPTSAWRRLQKRGKDLALGLAALIIPISVLKALSIVEFSGGRGFLLLTDVDTIFTFVMLVASVAIAVLLRRRGLFSAPVATFAGSLALATGAAMAYVVTNYGTVFRLRLMAMTPLWILSALLVAAASTTRARAAAAPEAVQRGSAPAPDAEQGTAVADSA